MCVVDFPQHAEPDQLAVLWLRPAVVFVPYEAKAPACYQTALAYVQGRVSLASEREYLLQPPADPPWRVYSAHFTSGHRGPDLPLFWVRVRVRRRASCCGIVLGRDPSALLICSFLCFFFAMNIYEDNRDGNSKETYYQSHHLDPAPPVDVSDKANGTEHDGRDMYRLGKKQQFQV